MSKETYYFSHDFDPTGDPKMSAMIGEYGAIGYGIFWRLAEMLHADKNHTLPLKKYLYQAIAKQLLNTCKQNLVIEDLPQFVETFIKDCIETFELFNLDGEHFSSNRVFRHFEKKKKISDLRSEIGKKGAIAKQNKNLPHSKKQKVPKESKVKESIINNKSNEPDLKKSNLFRQPDIPKFEEVHRIFLQNGGNEKMAKTFFNKNESTGWFYKGSPIKNYTNLVSSYIENWKSNEKNNGKRNFEQVGTNAEFDKP